VAVRVVRAEEVRASVEPPNAFFSFLVIEGPLGGPDPSSLSRPPEPPCGESSVAD